MFVDLLWNFCRMRHVSRRKKVSMPFPQKENVSRGQINSPIDDCTLICLSMAVALAWPWPVPRLLHPRLAHGGEPPCARSVLFHLPLESQIEVETIIIHAIPIPIPPPRVESSKGPKPGE